MSAALDPAEVEEILRMAAADAERLGHWGPRVTHAVHALSVRHRESFDGHFGRFGRTLVEDLLRRGRGAGPMKHAREMLDDAATVDDAMVAFREYLHLPAASAEELERDAHERWLVAVIEDRFRSYEIRRRNDVLDELYVLIAALKVTGFESSHQALRARLLALRE